MMECFQYYQDRIKFGLSKKFICLLYPTGITLYDPVDQSSKRLPRTPTGLEICRISRIICLNHKIVLLGLKQSQGYTAKILIYDLLSCKWKQGAEIPTDRFDHMFAFCASTEGSIYIAGGISKGGRPLRKAAIYKVDEDKWELLPEMNQEIERCRGVFIEGIFYVIGYMCCNKCERFDPKTGEWTTMQSMFAPMHKQVLYAFGQLIAFRIRGIDQYDWEGNVWRELVALPQEIKLFHPTATVWNDRILLCGFNSKFYMYKPGAISEGWNSVGQVDFLETVISIGTIEI
ncbi:hypothetical protein SUGI_0688170 [Cryptomeria japonica]|nr:hypothetical protein SUGI_0688170 [Cryptomeria japonica]